MVPLGRTSASDVVGRDGAASDGAADARVRCRYQRRGVICARTSGGQTKLGPVERPGGGQEMALAKYGQSARN